MSAAWPPKPRRQALRDRKIDSPQRHGAERGGLFRIAEAMANPDPEAGLRRLIAIFSDFWSAQESAIARLQTAGGIDPEFAQAIRARNERRRQARFPS